MWVGADTGGTFTDVVTETGVVVKVPSTPRDPGRAVRDGTGALRGAVDHLAHGTTVATNALLERRGGNVALVTTEGFADVIEIARQARPSLYDPEVVRPEPLVSRALRFEVPGRLDATGCEIEPIDASALDDVPADVEAVAVCLLHADLDAVHERAVAVALSGRGFDVTGSHEVSPEFREYERTVTTVVNAYLRPRCRRYLRSIDDVAGAVWVMTSAGGLVPVDTAAELPVTLLVSGPAGGVRAAAAVAAACGFPDAVSFDMGGTSTDVCLIRGGMPEPSPVHEVAGLPVRVPGLDVHTIGAGGGSIARIDPGGALVVGPESAGAEPGPACYGRGGIEPTATDADLVLGRIPADAGFPGLGRLDRAAAEAALARAGVTAEGVVQVVDAGMERAVRAVTVARGVDPRQVALVAFGGAGPLHACAVAEALGVPAVIVPPRAGVFSAVGLLAAPVQRDLVRTWPTPREHHGLAAARAELEQEVAALVPPDPALVVESSLDVRYAGQSHELTVAELDDFPAEHARRNGYQRPGMPVEVTAIRARARIDSPLRPTDLPAVERAPQRGPVVVAEPDCTVWIPDGWSARVAARGAWVLEREGRA